MEIPASWQFGTGLPVALAGVGITVTATEYEMQLLGALFGLLGVLLMISALRKTASSTSFMVRRRERKEVTARIKRLSLVAVRPTAAGFSDERIASQIALDGHRWWKRETAEQHYILGHIEFVYKKDEHAVKARLEQDKDFREWSAAQYGLSKSANVQKLIDAATEKRENSALVSVRFLLDSGSFNADETRGYPRFQAYELARSGDVDFVDELETERFEAEERKRRAEARRDEASNPRPDPPHSTDDP